MSLFKRNKVKYQMNLRDNIANQCFVALSLNAPKNASIDQISWPALAIQSYEAADAFLHQFVLAKEEGR